MEKKKILNYVNVLSDLIEDVALEIWNRPEISEEEEFASNLFRNILVENDFNIVEVKNMPTAFYAEYGEGRPVIAILGEYDALPDLSQELNPCYCPIVPGGPGHGCGHNLLGSAGLGAVLAIKEFLKEHRGTVRFYGCPAEETLVGKVRMIKEGAFDGCDLALSWHPMNTNVALNSGFLSNNSIKFKFHGISAHAGQSPESGRSALDSVEIMNVGANYLREHVIQEARIHYTITNAGGAPNIVPREAESWYFVRAPHRSHVNGITERLIRVGEGSALMNGTTMDYQVISGCYEKLENDTLYKLTYKNMMEVESPSYTEEELDFARRLQESLDRSLLEGELRKLSPEADIHNIRPIYEGVVDKEKSSLVSVTGSSDSGDVSFIMPMNLFLTASWPLGIAAHSWQATAASGSTIGVKGAVYAAKIFAAMMYDLYTNKSLVEEALEEFRERTRINKYISPLK